MESDPFLLVLEFSSGVVKKHVNGIPKLIASGSHQKKNQTTSKNWKKKDKKRRLSFRLMISCNITFVY